MFKYLNPKYYIKLLWQYKWELLLSVCMFSNLYSFVMTNYLYYVLWLAFIFAIVKMHTVSAGMRANLTFGLICLIILSTVINLSMFDYRWIMMCIILYITLCRTSYKFFHFKERFLFVSLFGYIFTGLINNYAHAIGFNYTLLYGLHAGEEFTIDFSGFANSPMWLSAACGIGIIFLSYWMNRLWGQRKRLLALLMLPLMFLTLQTLVWGGSRSALGISIGASLLLVWLSNKKIGKTILIFVSFGILAYVATPVLMSDSEKMQSKQGGMNFVDESGNTSRTALWNARMEEFKSSPIWGIGFGVTGIGEDATTGRAETGSGWLTVLSQTGMVGLIFVLLIVKRAVLPLRLLRNNSRMALYSALLAFLCLHTMFEAYLFQSGWYLCFVLWLVVSILDDYKKYYKIDAVMR
jgi:hypothetical protein